MRRRERREVRRVLTPIIMILFKHTCCPSVGRPPLDMSPRTIFTREFCPPRHYSLVDFVPPGHYSLVNTYTLIPRCTVGVCR